MEKSKQPTRLHDIRDVHPHAHVVVSEVWDDDDHVSLVHMFKASYLQNKAVESLIADGKANYFVEFIDVRFRADGQTWPYGLIASWAEWVHNAGLTSYEVG